MPRKRSELAFWRQREPARRYDIARLRPNSLPKKERFETGTDAAKESERSEEVLRSQMSALYDQAEYLSECRAGDYKCSRPFCPICARDFRRWLIGELLSLTDKKKDVRIYTILLKEAGRDDIGNLDPAKHDALLRKRLARAGLEDDAAIGAFEIVYKARRKVWILHINLVTLGGSATAHKTFRDACNRTEIKRPVTVDRLNDSARQLSYVPKFTTYHRPHEQQGRARSVARPLNAREHSLLVKWMDGFEFKDFLFLYNARRNGATIDVKPK